MKKYSYLAVLSLLIWLPLSKLAAANEFSRIKEATTLDQCILLGLEHEISEVQADIQSYHRGLAINPCDASEGGDPNLLECNLYYIDPNTGESTIPLTSERQSYYGTRLKHFFTEFGIVEWQGENVSSFRFVQKRSQIGTSNLLTRTLTSSASISNTGKSKFNVDSCLKMSPQERQSVGAPIDLIIEEQVGIGKANAYTLRFPSASDIKQATETVVIDGVRQTRQTSHVWDRNEEITIGQRKLTVRVIFVRDAKEKINIAREYLRMLKLLRRRIDWHNRGADLRRSREAMRVLKTR